MSSVCLACKKCWVAVPVSHKADLVAHDYNPRLWRKTSELLRSLTFEVVTDYTHPEFKHHLRYMRLCLKKR